MQRRTFIQLSALTGLGLFVSPGLAFAQEVEFPANELMGKVRPQLYGDNYNLRKDASEAFAKMRTAAREDGIKMYSASSFRSYDHQNRIWERKYKKYTTAQGLSPEKAIEKIIRYSTIPGTSRHHWGSDLDVIDLAVSTPSDPLLARHYQAGGVYEKLGVWLREKGEDFGFYEVYTNNPEREGFEYEPWHLTYAPLGIPMLKAYLKLDLKDELQASNLMGSSHFSDEFVQGYIEKNLKGINPALL